MYFAYHFPNILYLHFLHKKAKSSLKIPKTYFLVWEMTDWSFKASFFFPILTLPLWKLTIRPDVPNDWHHFLRLQPFHHWCYFNGICSVHNDLHISCAHCSQTIHIHLCDPLLETKATAGLLVLGHQAKVDLPTDLLLELHSLQTHCRCHFADFIKST